MTLPRWWRHTITVLVADRIVERGDVILDWSNPTRTEYRGCHVQPMAGDEVFVSDGRRNAVVTRWKLFAPPNVVVGALDRVKYAGTTYELDGAPRAWPSASGRLDHLEAILQLVEG